MESVAGRRRRAGKEPEHSAHDHDTQWQIGSVCTRVRRIPSGELSNDQIQGSFYAYLAPACWRNPSDRQRDNRHGTRRSRQPRPHREAGVRGRRPANPNAESQCRVARLALPSNRLHRPSHPGWACRAGTAIQAGRRSRRLAAREGRPRDVVCSARSRDSVTASRDRHRRVDPMLGINTERERLAHQPGCEK